MKRQVAIMMLGLWLGGCDGGAGSGPGAGADNGAAANQASADANQSAAAGAGNAQAKAKGGVPPCPFRETSDWHGSVEAGRLVVNGKVDVLMAGFKPGLTKRAGAAPGTIALEMALVPEPGGRVHERAKYEERGAPRYKRAEIYCGGERIAQVDVLAID